LKAGRYRGPTGTFDVLLQPHHSSAYLAARQHFHRLRCLCSGGTSRKQRLAQRGRENSVNRSGLVDHPFRFSCECQGRSGNSYAGFRGNGDRRSVGVVQGGLVVPRRGQYDPSENRQTGAPTTGPSAGFGYSRNAGCQWGVRCVHGRVVSPLIALFPQRSLPAPGPIQSPVGAAKGT